MKGNGYRGIFTIDALIALIPIVLIVYIGLVSFSMRGQAAGDLYRDSAMLNMLEASDYMIRKGAVCDNSACHAGWVGGMGDSEYYAGFAPLENASCIYRIVNYQNKDDIRKIYICKP